jgi:hypothetical protein
VVSPSILTASGRADNVAQQAIILSGGLGGSAYLRKQLEVYFKSFPHINATEPPVIACQEPRLIVTRGLLFEGQQRWITTGSLLVLATRTARASYGIVVQEIYSPDLHIGEVARQDAYGLNTKWAINQIQWLIRKGDVIKPGMSLVKSFEIRCDAGSSTWAWDSEVVVCREDTASLPRSLRAGEFEIT